MAGDAAASGRLAVLPLLVPIFEPPPCPLTDQQLVELLKHPLCVGEARRVVLTQFENRYLRPFADQWEFVAFAKNLPPMVVVQHLLPQKARILLMLALTRTKDPREIQRIFNEY